MNKVKRIEVIEALSYEDWRVLMFVNPGDDDEGKLVKYMINGLPIVRSLNDHAGRRCLENPTGERLTFTRSRWYTKNQIDACAPNDSTDLSVLAFMNRWGSIVVSVNANELLDRIDYSLQGVAIKRAGSMPANEVFKDPQRSRLAVPVIVLQNNRVYYFRDSLVDHYPDKPKKWIRARGGLKSKILRSLQD